MSYHKPTGFRFYRRSWANLHSFPSRRFLCVEKRVGQELVVGMIKTPVRAASLLATGEPLEFEQREDRLWVRGLPERAYADPHCTVVKLELDGEPESYPRWL